jgi:hypothetical protein
MTNYDESSKIRLFKCRSGIFETIGGHQTLLDGPRIRQDPLGGSVKLEGVLDSKRALELVPETCIEQYYDNLV